MGTNYFSVRRGIEERDDWWDLRETEEVLHIGKSSAGWCFSLHIIPEMGINSLDDWIPVFIDPHRLIIDEYRDVIGLDKIMRVITCRGRADPNTWSDEMYRINHAVPGPGNLVRHSIEHGCVGHGPGTWDYIKGYFS